MSSQDNIENECNYKFPESKRDVRGYGWCKYRLRVSFKMQLGRVLLSDTKLVLRCDCSTFLFLTLLPVLQGSAPSKMACRS